MANVTFNIITTMLFGRNISGEIGKVEYIDSNNYTVYELDFADCYTRISKDIMGNRFTVKTLFFPILNRFDIMTPYNINYKNIRALWKATKEFLAKNREEDSIYNRMLQKEGAEEESVFQDLFGFLFAGHETSSHAIGSTVYFLYKNPEVKEKLEKELSEFMGKSHEEIGKILNKEKLEELDYLHMVVKESLRVDPPAGEALPYEIIADTSVCGVELKKGDVINVNILPRHYDPEEWHDPLKFIPERFDPESKYFTTPKSGKARDPLSWMPFSTHLRICPGQSLAMLEIKVILVYLLSRVNFEFADHLMESDYAYFSIISQLTLNFSAELK